MIIDFCNKRNFFRNANADTVFICSFDLLYQYSKLSLRRFIKYYPGIKNTLKTKKFGNNTCRMFRSEKYEVTKLLVLSTKVSEPGNVKDVDKNILFIKRMFSDKIMADYDYDDDHCIYRIDLSSFSVTHNKKILFKLLRVFAESGKKFKIYY